MPKRDLDSLKLETPRLILRPPRLEDFDAWAAFLDDEVATQFIGGRQPRSIARPRGDASPPPGAH